MGTTTTTFALNKPTVGGDDNAWGSDLNANADKIDDLLDGTTAIKPNLDVGLWKVGGVAVTSTAAELNVLDGVAGLASQAEAQAGTDNTKLMTPLRSAQAIEALGGGINSLGTITTTSGSSQSLVITAPTQYDFLLFMLNGVSISGTGDIFITSSLSSRKVGTFGSAGTALNGFVLVRVVGGNYTAISADNASGAAGNVYAGSSGINTSTTTLTFVTVSTFDAGTITVFGMK